MLKYLRLGLILFVEFFYSYLFVVVPNVLFRKRWSLMHRYTTLRIVVRRLYRALRIKLYLTNDAITQTKGPYLIVCNHHSMLDPFLLIYLFKYPVRFISKKEVRRLFIFGDATASIDALFINRKSVRSQLAKLEEMKQSLIAKDTHWLVFPEATRNKQYSNPLMPFKAGTFKQAMEAKATILPMVTYGFFRPLDPKLNWKQYPVQVDFLPTITPDMYEGKTSVQLSDEVQTLMQTASDVIRLKDATLPRR
jgi:1-acyl-sn-glycerol-3-phosphate acyltransferase